MLGNILIKKNLLVTAAVLLAITSGSFLNYVYSPKFVPKVLRSATKSVGDKLVGKELAEKIDDTRDESGATSIRLLFNTNKEENLEKHCEKKEEKGQIQEKCFKTYTNEEFGYSVEYPIDWQIYQTDVERVSFANENDIEQLKNDEIKYSDTDVPFTFGKVISLAILENQENLSLEEYAKQNLLSSESEGFIENKITKNNIAGIYVFDRGSNRFGGGIGEYFLFKQENELFAIWLDHVMLTTEPNKELSDIFQGMIDSLKL